jgi:hypothetical protein
VEVASNVNVHDTKAFMVTEVNILEHLGNGSGAGGCRVNLYITRGTEEE